MTDASTSIHEPLDKIRPETLENRRGLTTLLEELEAVDWYDQRADATQDEQLKAILIHNRDEEKEHAMMALEWLRRRDPVLDTQMRTYLFTDGDIVQREAIETTDAIGAAVADPADTTQSSGSLGIGSLKEAG